MWLPFLNKKLGKLYLKVIGKYTDYYESLNIIKPKSLKKNLLDLDLEIISLGKKEFRDNFDIKQIEKIQVKIIKRFCVFFANVSFLRKLFLNIAIFLNVYYPIKIIARKR